MAVCKETAAIQLHIRDQAPSHNVPAETSLPDGSLLPTTTPGYIAGKRSSHRSDRRRFYEANTGGSQTTVWMPGAAII